MKTTNLTLEKLLDIVKNLSLHSYCKKSDIPEVLKEDFNTFISGKALSIIDNEEVTYDMKLYYNKLYYGKGIDYKVKFMN